MPDLSDIISVEHLAYTYPGVEDTPGVPVFADLNLTIEEGSFVAVLGTNGCGKSLSKRTTGHVNTRNMFHVRMSLKHGADVTQSFQLLYREISFLCKCCIQTRCYMSFGKNKSVSVRIFRIFWIYIHLYKIQISKYLCCG